MTATRYSRPLTSAEYALALKRAEEFARAGAASSEIQSLNAAVALALGEPPGKDYCGSWTHSAPLLDRFRIDLRHHDDGTVDAFMRLDGRRKAHATGRTGPEAAMRALVKCMAIAPSADLSQRRA